MQERLSKFSVVLYSKIKGEKLQMLTIFKAELKKSEVDNEHETKREVDNEHETKHEVESTSMIFTRQTVQSCCEASTVRALVVKC